MVLDTKYLIFVTVNIVIITFSNSYFSLTEYQDSTKQNLLFNVEQTHHHALELMIFHATREVLITLRSPNMTK